MSKSSEAVKRWRKNTKDRMVKSMGGCCQICGYNRSQKALEFHHINPNEKEFSFGKLRANPQGVNTLIEELKKCIMLCSNCHKEVHYNGLDIPKEYAILNEEYLISEAEKKKKLNNTAHSSSG